ncbi:hypothetical protein A0H81_13358 [Grifola frondosa]|uniref:Uncharacterized protein n=1 Tax=Grifola frondosa TaxID=5627 RepID=A0A1C7LQD7_GRIFR|nr:hypothetical protein A0H81_13358 [Grifola frondosa]
MSGDSAVALSVSAVLRDDARPLLPTQAACDSLPPGQVGVRDLFNAERYWEEQFSGTLKEMGNLSACNTALLRATYNIRQHQDDLAKHIAQIGVEFGELRDEFAESFCSVKRLLVQAGG